MKTDVPKYVPVRNGGAAIKMNPEYVALWESYLDEGMAAKHVGEIFGVHVQTIRKYYPGRAWSNKECLALGTQMKHHNERMKRIA